MSLLERAMEFMGLSARAGGWIATKISRYVRNDSLAASRTIADLGVSETVIEHRGSDTVSEFREEGGTSRE